MAVSEMRADTYLFNFAFNNEGQIRERHKLEVNEITVQPLAYAGAKKVVSYLADRISIFGGILNAPKVLLEADSLIIRGNERCVSTICAQELLALKADDIHLERVLIFLHEHARIFVVTNGVPVASNVVLYRYRTEGSNFVPTNITLYSTWSDFSSQCGAFGIAEE